MSISKFLCKRKNSPLWRLVLERAWEMEELTQTLTGFLKWNKWEAGRAGLCHEHIMWAVGTLPHLPRLLSRHSTAAAGLRQSPHPSLQPWEWSIDCNHSRECSESFAILIKTSPVWKWFHKKPGTRGSILTAQDFSIFMVKLYFVFHPLVAGEMYWRHWFLNIS